MPATNYNITLEQGATFNQTLTWNDASGSPVDLTGYIARLQARNTLENSIAYIDLTTENGGITLGGVSGTITLSLSATQTAAITVKNGVYDLELESAGAVVTRLIQGNIILSEQVTR